MPPDAKTSWSLAYKLELLILSFDNSWSKFAEKPSAPDRKSKTRKEIPDTERIKRRKRKRVRRSSPEG